MAMEHEFDHAIKLAHKVLDRRGGDPDDDLAVLARQFLRAIDRETEQEISSDFDWSALQRLRHGKVSLCGND